MTAGRAHRLCGRSSLALLVALAIFLFAAQTASAQTRLVVQSGTIGPAECAVYDHVHHLLFVGGADGTVRAWEPQSGDLERTMQVSHLRVRMIAANPAHEQIAVFLTDGINVNRIEVWSFRTDSLLFTRELSEAPLFLSYSPSGDLLAYGLTEWRGIVFLDSQSGKELPYLSTGFGIVSSAVVSTTGKSVMTYSPSGEISYWSLDSGTLKESLPTLPNLTAISYTPGYLYMIGTDGTQLAVVDLVTGQTVASVPLTGVRYTSVDPSTDEIASYSVASNGESHLSLWSFSSNALYRIDGAFDPPPARATGILFAGGTLYATLSDGALYAQQPSQPARTFGEDNLLTIDDFGLSGSKLLLSTRDEFLIFGSDLFDLADPQRSTQLTYDMVGNPFRAKTGVTPLHGERFALWRMDSRPAALALAGPASFRVLPTSFGGRLIDVRRAGSLIATLDSNGACSLIDPESGSPTFSYTAFGTRTIVSTAENRLIAGLARGSPFNTALLQINTTTGETVPIPSDDRMVFDLAYDPTTHSLYSLGIRGEGPNLRTVLAVHDAATLSSGIPLLTRPGADLGATLVVDPSSGALYTTVGYRGVQRILPGSAPDAYTLFQRTNHLPRKVVVARHWVISLNSDSSLSMWDKQSGRWALDFYVFKNWSWLAILPSGKFYASPGALRYIKAYRGDSLTPLDAARYRIGS